MQKPGNAMKTSRANVIGENGALHEPDLLLYRHADELATGGTNGRRPVFQIEQVSQESVLPESPVRVVRRGSLRNSNGLMATRTDSLHRQTGNGTRKRADAFPLIVNRPSQTATTGTMRRNAATPLQDHRLLPSSPDTVPDMVPATRADTARGNVII
jgi:hypothetical protein